MSYEIDIVIPRFSDEIDDVQISNWLKSEGEFVEFGEPVIELEVNKSNVELDAPVAGILAAIYCWEGEEVISGERIGVIQVEDDEMMEDEGPAIIDIDKLAEEEDEPEESMHDNLDNLDEENLI
jgi:pyruvate/2-oxoglutarate dehydrogenase complex dihydrolipoamide acyltransferase (E2) component